MEFAELKPMQILSKYPGHFQSQNICGILKGGICNGNEGIDDLSPGLQKHIFF